MGRAHNQEYPLPFHLNDLHFAEHLDHWLARFAERSADEVAEIFMRVRRFSSLGLSAVRTTENLPLRTCLIPEAGRAEAAGSEGLIDGPVERPASRCQTVFTFPASARPSASRTSACRTPCTPRWRQPSARPR